MENPEEFRIYGWRTHESPAELIGEFQLGIMRPIVFDPTLYVRIEMYQSAKKVAKVTGDICTKCGTRTKPVRVRDMTIPGLTPYGNEWLCCSCMVGRLTEDISATAPLGSPVVLT